MQHLTLWYSAALVIWVAHEALASSPSFKYIGCYKDAGTRDLPHWTGTPGSTALTTTYCMNYCDGYIFFATQDGYACMCGNSLGLYGLAPASDCNMPCQLNAGAICGGPWRNSLYRMDFKTPGYLGCFIDASTRDLDGKLTYAKQGTALTAQMCRTICSKYTYFALQNGNACLCGNRIGLYGQAAETDCNLKCQGNGAEVCGGPWRNSAYLVGSSAVALPNLASEYRGCYIDQATRDLNGKLTWAVAGIPFNAKFCQDACQGFKYFGLQDGSACLCGDNYGTYGETAESDCNMQCAGYEGQYCGGPWRNSVYGPPKTQPKPKPKPKPQPKPKKPTKNNPHP